MTEMNQRLAGKTCIVTGSGGSIGRATALRFAAEGANVVGCDIAVPSAEETVRLVEQAGGSMMSVHPLDLTNKAQCERLVAAAVIASAASMCSSIMARWPISRGSAR